MEIIRNGSSIEFTDRCNFSCEIDASNDNLNFSISWECDGSADFSQDQIKSLLPYLQAFAESGTLEPQETTLQGEDEQGKRIKELEQLVREWRSTVFASSSLALNNLQKKTSQLLGE